MTGENMLNIRPMERSDSEEVIAMMEVFYASPAVMTNGSREIFEADVGACVGGSPYLDGLIFEIDGNTAGYAMLAHGFSTEFGKRCVWIEDIYIKPQYRRRGIGFEFFRRLGEQYPDFVFRLEAERENAAAIALYEKCGFEELPYLEMIRRIR